MNKYQVRIVIFSISFMIVGIIIGNGELISNKDTEEASKNSKYDLNVKYLNVIPNDKLDDTESIQKAIDSLSANGGGTVFFPKGVYLIDAVKSIQLKNNISLHFEDGTVLEALPNKEEAYEILQIHDVRNISVIGKVKIIGERNKHLGKTGEWGMGISIKGSEEVRVINPIIQDCWGDGIYVGSSETKNYSKNVTIENPVLINNRRQGISLISAIKLSIKNPVIINTNGTPPSSGIDLEPNHPSEFMKDIKIINPSTEKNEGYGILFALGILQNSKNEVKIEINTTKNINDNIGLFIPSSIKGNIKIGSEYILRTS